MAGRLKASPMVKVTRPMKRRTSVLGLQLLLDKTEHIVSEISYVVKPRCLVSLLFYIPDKTLLGYV